MRIGMLSFTERGWRLSARLAAAWESEEKRANGKAGEKTDITRCVRCAALPQLSERRDGWEIVADWWQTMDGIVIFGAAGIAVRLIAPFVQHKSGDPAVVVIDERGSFSISLLSGHLGGANALAERAAALLQAVPVITTATDRAGAFAVDLFAKENGLKVTDFEKAKAVSAKVLRGERLRIYAETPFDAAHFRGLPEDGSYQLVAKESLAEADILIGVHTLDSGFEAAACARQECGPDDRKPQVGIGLFLPLRRLYLGIGARRNVSKEAVTAGIRQGLAALSLSENAVAGLASIDLKKNEAGICGWAEEHRLPYLTFSADALRALPGLYTESAFVQSVTGVSNVCERAACCAAGSEAILLLRKQIYGDVTLAIAFSQGEQEHDSF